MGVSRREWASAAANGRQPPRLAPLISMDWLPYKYSEEMHIKFYYRTGQRFGRRNDEHNA